MDPVIVPISPHTDNDPHIYPIAASSTTPTVAKPAAAKPKPVAAKSKPVVAKPKPAGSKPAKPIGMPRKPRRGTLLHTGEPIESLNNKEDGIYVDEDGEEWVLPNSKGFQDFIAKKFGVEYMVKKVDFLKDIIASTEASPAFPYQKFVRDYLKFGTPYRSLLLEHGLGSGKSRSAIMVAESFRDEGLRTLILTPAFLRTNFKDEVAKWARGGPDVDKWYLYAHYNAYGHPPGSKDKHTGELIGGKGGVFEQLAKHGIGFPQGHRNEFSYLTNKYPGLKPPEHMLIIIEESHNLNRAMIDNKDNKIKALLYPLLMMARDCKFIMLSGTPIVSNPFEMAPVYNILRGEIGDGHYAYPTSESKFIDNFVDYKKQEIVRHEFLMRRMLGLNSYFKGITKDEGRVIFPHKSEETVTVTMSRYQADMHDVVFAKERESTSHKKKQKRKLLDINGPGIGTATAAHNNMNPTSSYHTNSRQLCNFAFPPGISRPQQGRKRTAELEKHIFEFRHPATGTQVSNIKQLKDVYMYIQTRGVLDFGVDAINQYFEGATDADLPEYREKLSFNVASYMIEELGGVPAETHALHDCLSVKDRLNAIKYIGTYEQRFQMALKFLGRRDNREKIFSLEKLRRYSAKMAAIYEKIVGDTANGAPHVIDDPEYEGEAEEGDVELIKIDAVDDKDDPLKEHLNVFSDLPAGKIVEGGPALVYSYFNKVEGAGIFSMVLRAHGFEPFDMSVGDPKKLPKRPRYAVFSGGMSTIRKRNILKVFNSKENAHGQLIRVIFVTQAAAEGISIFNLRQIHIMEPHWDNVKIEQVIGRGFRLRSHQHLERFEERTVHVYRYMLAHPDGSTGGTADDLVHDIAVQKDHFRHQVDKLRHQCAVDCYLNRDYNEMTDECFTFHGTKHGRAFYPTLQEDRTKGSMRKVGVKREKAVLVDNKYVYYPDKVLKARIKLGGKTFEKPVYKIFGPLTRVVRNADGNLVVPDTLLHYAYIVKLVSGGEKILEKSMVEEL